MGGCAWVGGWVSVHLGAFDLVAVDAVAVFLLFAVQRQRRIVTVGVPLAHRDGRDDVFAGR